MIILKHYRIVNRNGIFYVISKKPHRCPCCQGPLKVRDSRPRQLILSDETMTFQLRRLKCQNCGALHLEIPDLILPHKHYSREVIETGAKLLDWDLDTLLSKTLEAMQAKEQSIASALQEA